MPVGTLTNIVTVLAGTTIGALAGRRFPERIRSTVLATLGLATVAVAVREVLPTGEFPLVLGAVLLGAVLGELLRIEAALTAVGRALQRRFAPDDELDLAVLEDVQPGHGRFVEGFVVASLVFCVGPLTIVGSIQDGLGDPELLYVKSALDGFASIAFAAVYGWGVAAAAITVAVIQGSIALSSGLLDSVLSEPMVDALSASGGILLFGIALRLLGLAQIRVANLLPGIALAPLFVAWWG